MADVILASVHRDTGDAIPTEAALVEGTGRARRTVYRALAWLRSHGWLVQVERGSTPRWRSNALKDEYPEWHDRNRASVYTLTAPAPTPQKMAPPTRSSFGGITLYRAREASEQQASARPLSAVADTKTKAGRLAACRYLLREIAHMRGASARAWRHTLAPWFAAGWTLGDVRHALQHHPDGPAHWQTTKPKDPLACYRARLMLWEGIDPLSAQLRAADRARREEQERFKRQWEEMESQRSARPSEHANAIREMLRMRRG